MKTIKLQISSGISVLIQIIGSFPLNSRWRLTSYVIEDFVYSLGTLLII